MNEKSSRGFRQFRFLNMPEEFNPTLQSPGWQRLPKNQENDCDLPAASPRQRGCFPRFIIRRPLAY
jgi:hypothetical protein